MLNSADMLIFFPLFFPTSEFIFSHIAFRPNTPGFFAYTHHGIFFSCLIGAKMALAARARGKSSDVWLCENRAGWPSRPMSWHLAANVWTDYCSVMRWSVWALSTWKMAPKITKSTEEIYRLLELLAGTFEEWLLQILEHATLREKRFAKRSPWSFNE